MVFNLAPWLIVGAILGARILYVISYWDKEFAGRPFTHIFNMRAGLVYYGGLIGASLAGIIFCYRNKVPLWRMGDVMAPSVALGHAFGRIGCFMTGCCYGGRKARGNLEAERVVARTPLVIPDKHREAVRDPGSMAQHHACP